MSTILALLLAGCVIISKSQTPTPTPMPSRLPDPEMVKSLLVRVVDEEKRVPGIVVGMIADNPQERWVVGYGKLSTSDERVPDGDTVFEIGSITKVFTGTLLAQAVMNGEVKLDDPISIYLPEGVTAPQYEGKSITLLDLTTHTSGLPRDPIYTTDQKKYTLDQLYAFLSSCRLISEPGTAFNYSNLGVGLLGNLLVQRAGKPDYETLLYENITHPLGMNKTSIQLTDDMLSNLATPHMNYSIGTNYFELPSLAGAGSIRSTANDMLTFLAANMGFTETELDPALQLANTPQRSTGSSLEVGYRVDQIGLGWFFTSTAKGTIHWHGGRTNGYYTLLAWDPERRIGVVVLANASVPIEDIAFLLMDQPVLVQVEPQILDAYAGRYQFPNGMVITVRVDGTRIFIQVPDQPEYELSARSENQFRPIVFEAEITFFTNDSGEVDRLVMTQFGNADEAVKVP